MSDELKPCPFCGCPAICVGEPWMQSEDAAGCDKCCAEAPTIAAWNTRPAPTEAEVLAAAKRAAAANSSMHEGCDLELFWSYLDERAQAHWLKVVRAALGVGS